MAAAGLLTASGDSNTPKESSDQWDFLKKRNVIPQGNTAQSYNKVIKNHCVQFGSTQSVSDTERDLILQRVRNMPDIHVVSPYARVRRRHYVKPINPTEGQHFQSYIVGALDFAQAKIPDLSPLPKSISVVKQDGEYLDMSHQAGIADYYYTQYQVEGLPILFPQREEGSSIAFQSYDDWYIIFGAGPSGLMAPFSEGLVPSTHVREKEFQMPGVDNFIYLQLLEAITEGLSLTLALEYGKEIGIPHIEVRVDEGRKTLSKYPEYKYVPASEKMIADMGIANAYTFFRESDLAVYKQSLDNYL